MGFPHELIPLMMWESDVMMTTGEHLDCPEEHPQPAKHTLDKLTDYWLCLKRQTFDVQLH